MKFPHCNAARTSKLKAVTHLRYKQYKCGGCDRQFNERTGTDLNFLEWPAGVKQYVGNFAKMNKMERRLPAEVIKQLTGPEILEQVLEASYKENGLRHVVTE